MNLQRMFIFLTVATASSSVSPSCTVTYWKIRSTPRGWEQFVLLISRSLEIMTAWITFTGEQNHPYLWLKKRFKAEERWKWKEIFTSDFLLFGSSVERTAGKWELILKKGKDEKEWGWLKDWCEPSSRLMGEKPLTKRQKRGGLCPLFIRPASSPLSS